jgi:hypothetical protein
MAAILASLVAGGLWSIFGPQATFLFGACAATAASLALLGMKRTEVMA